MGNFDKWLISSSTSPRHESLQQWPTEFSRKLQEERTVVTYHVHCSYHVYCSYHTYCFCGCQNFYQGLYCSTLLITNRVLTRFWVYGGSGANR